MSMTFSSTLTADDIENTAITEISTSEIHDFPNHPFPLYSEKDLESLADSIKENGIIEPIVVVKNDYDNNGGYIILSGHNRVHAARLANLDSVPARIIDDISHENAAVLVTESNLQQRSFRDLEISERIEAVAFHLNALQKAYRSRELLQAKMASSNAYQGKGEVAQKAAEDFGLAVGTLRMYGRLIKLIKPLREMIDNCELQMNAADLIANFEESAQQDIYDIYDNAENSIVIKQPLAKVWSKIYGDGTTWNKEEALKAYNKEAGIGENKSHDNVKPFTVDKKEMNKVLKRHFDPGTKPVEIERRIDTALEFMSVCERSLPDSHKGIKPVVLQTIFAEAIKKYGDEFIEQAERMQSESEDE